MAGGGSFYGDQQSAHATGTLKVDYLFGTEGLNTWIPGSGVVFDDGVYLDLTNTTGVTITYT